MTRHSAIISRQGPELVSPHPYAMGPTGSWVGPDGPWGSFFIHVGGKDAVGGGQTFHAFPALSLSIVLLPLPTTFCNQSSKNQWNDMCDHRGTMIADKWTNWEPDNSTSWLPQGNASVLDASNLQNLSDDNNTNIESTYGTDYIGLGQSGFQSLTLPKQTVAGSMSKTFFMALFGLSNMALNLGKDRSTTFLENFRDVSAIPSNSVSYTAGSYAKRLLPNLVLGGYDSTRFDSSTTLEIDFRNTTEAADPYQLTVNIAAITIASSEESSQSNTSSSIQSPTIQKSVPLETDLMVNIDPVTPQIWLPESACRTFESAFDLQWDETSKFYVINQTTHERLLRTSPNVTFSIKSSRADDSIKNFTLPYQTVFDLNVTYPYVKSWKYYFPLKRASDPSQYMLGRAFFQEVHISIDYDSRYFNLSQAKPDSGGQNLVAIEPRTKPSSNDTISDTRSTRLSRGAYGGIGTGVGVAVLIIAFFLIAWRKDWLPFGKKDGRSKRTSQHEKAELQDTGIPRVEAESKERKELAATNEHGNELADKVGLRHELATPQIFHELGSGRRSGMDQDFLPQRHGSRRKSVG